MQQQKEDIYKIAVSVVMIHLILIIIFEGFALTSNNPGDSVVLERFNDIIGDSASVSNQISDVGLCVEGTTTEAECEARGCVWDSGQCFNAIEDRGGVDFSFYDVILSIIKIPLYLGKVIMFLGSIVFFELILSIKLMPLITIVPLRFLLTILLWGYNILIIYYLWAFISNWRGQR